MKITFSSDTGRISRGDMDITSQMAEDYFGMNSDSEQIPAIKENRDWIFKNIPECLNMIKDGNKIIGYSFVLPSNKEIMKCFLEKKINEKDMFQKIKGIKIYGGVNAIYLCAAFIKEEYRGKGLAIEAASKIIRLIVDKIKEKPILYFQGYSNEGRKAAFKVARELELEIKMRD